jgi:glycosyltransferase involved in cell wall biosynthesis
MKIGMVLDHEFPTDERVNKEAHSLIESNFEVFLLSLSFGKLSRHENYQGINVRRAYMPKLIYKKLSALILTIPVYEWFWLYQMKKFIIENNISALHVHDLPLIGVGLKISKQFNIPLVGDMHENFPILVATQRYANSFWGRILISKKKWFSKEKEWLKQVDYIICVSQENKERLRSVLQKSEGFFVVPNTVHATNFLKIQKRVRQVENKFKDTFNVLYFGGFDSSRDLKTLLKAADFLRDKIKALRVIMIGSGSAYPQLLQQVEKLNLEQIVSFEGWQDSEYLISYMKVAHISLITHVKSEHTDTTSPNKLFIYQLFKRPIISSNLTYIRKILEENRCGLLYESGNYEDLAQKILLLYNNADLRKEYGENAYKAVINKYNWEITSKELIDLYTMISEDYNFHK